MGQLPKSVVPRPHAALAACCCSSCYYYRCCCCCCCCLPEATMAMAMDVPSRLIARPNVSINHQPKTGSLLHLTTSTSSSSSSSDSQFSPLSVYPPPSPSFRTKMCPKGRGRSRSTAFSARASQPSLASPSSLGPGQVQAPRWTPREAHGKSPLLMLLLHLHLQLVLQPRLLAGRR